MVGKSYLRYVPGPDGPIVVSPLGQALVCHSFGQSRNQQRGVLARTTSAQQSSSASLTHIALVPLLEHVGVWNLRTGALLGRLSTDDARRGSTNEVTALSVFRPVGGVAASGDSSSLLVAIGFASGHVALWRGRSSTEWEPILYALGHKPDTMVLSLAFNEDGSRLFSGGQDTDIAVWDTFTAEPLYRLRGHRGNIIGIIHLHNSLSPSGAIVTASHEGLVKLWDLSVQRCVQTIIASDTQVTSIATDPTMRRLFVGLREPHVKVFSLEHCYPDKSGGAARSSALTQDATFLAATGSTAASATAVATSLHEASITDYGILPRKEVKPATAMRFSDDGRFFIVVSSRSVEVYRTSSEELVRKKLQRKRARAAKSAAKNAVGEEDEDGSGPATTAVSQRSIAEELSVMRCFVLDTKVRAVEFAPRAMWQQAPPTSTGAADEDTVLPSLVLTTNENAIEIHSVVPATVADATAVHYDQAVDLKKRSAIEIMAHRSDIRQVAFSANDLTLFSMSRESIKLWGIPNTIFEKFASDDATPGAAAVGEVRANRDQRLACIGSIDLTDSSASSPQTTSGATAADHHHQGSSDAHATCFVCLPGDMHLAVGFSDGSLRVVSVGSASLGDIIAAHTGPITSMALRPDGSGIYTVGQDRRVIKWDLAVTDVSAVDLTLNEELELSESPLVVAPSPDGKLVAIGFQNNNVQLFYADSMKPFVVLYGHKLPVTGIAFSSDGTLCATVGMDKSLRFWGTDFGDCHRSIHAHDDYVTSVRFIASTHYVVTAAMDGAVKVWDGDTWAIIQVSRIHQRGLWSAAVNADGTCIVSAGVDRSVRTLLRTDEVLFPEEEQERIANEALDDAAAKKQAMSRWEETAVDSSVGVVGQKSAATAHAAEILMDALDMVSVEVQRQEALAAQKAGKSTTGAMTIPPPHPVLRGRTPWQYLWSVLETIRPSELRHALASLTSIHIEALLDNMRQMHAHRAILNYEIAARILLALVKPAPGTNSEMVLPIGSEAAPRRLMVELRRAIGAELEQVNDEMGLNIAGLRFLKQSLQESRVVKFHDYADVQGARKKFQSSSAAAAASAASGKEGTSSSSAGSKKRTTKQTTR